MTKPNQLEINAAALKRWRTRLKRAMTMIDKLERQRRRLEAKAAKPKVEQPKAAAPVIPATPAAPVIPAPASPVTPDDLAIPTFLQRKKLDPAAVEIAEQQEATKRAKMKGRFEKAKARRRGDLKKMPLTGKAALEAIRNG